MTPTFWKHKDVLITGHTGFKGGWLSLWLQELGARVTGFGLEPPTRPSLFERANVAEGMRSVLGDVRDLASVQQVFEHHQPEIVFHLAAQPLVRESYRTPVETFAANLLGTVHVLEAARQTPSVRAIVIVTTDKCYENREQLRGYREGDRLGGHDPYSASKACAELATCAYQRSFFADSNVGVATARAGNVIGGGDWAADRITPDAVRSIANGLPLSVRNPYAIRPWQHVLEPLAGYLLLAEKLHDDSGAYSGPWNFGPDESDSVTVAELLDLFFECWGEGSWTRQSDAMNLHETATLRLDASKAHTQLGWRPRLTLPEAVGFTVSWYREALAGAAPGDLRSLTCEQIQTYQESLAAWSTQQPAAA
jgi:CDP-glucose 4,6-dehydratase